MKKNYWYVSHSVFLVEHYNFKWRVTGTKQINNINYVACIYEIRKCFCALICLHTECTFSINITDLTLAAIAKFEVMLTETLFLLVGKLFRCHQKPGCMSLIKRMIP